MCRSWPIISSGLLRRPACLGAGPAAGAALWLVFTAFRMLGEAVQVYLYDKTGKVLSRSTAYGLALIALGLVGAYLPAALGLQWPAVLAGALLHPAFVTVCVLVGAGCAYYVVWGYRGYERKLPRSLDLNFLLSTLLKASAVAPARDVEVKESDAVLEAGQYARLQRLKGYDYLNAMFFLQDTAASWCALCGTGWPLQGSGAVQCAGICPLAAGCGPQPEPQPYGDAAVLRIHHVWHDCGGKRPAAPCSTTVTKIFCAMRGTARRASSCAASPSVCAAWRCTTALWLRRLPCGGRVLLCMRHGYFYCRFLAVLCGHSAAFAFCSQRITCAFTISFSLIPKACR